MSFFSIATSRHEYKFNTGLITYIYEDDYLYIKVKTINNPEIYRINNNFELHFHNISEYQIFINYLEEDEFRANTGRYVIVNYPQESEFADFEHFIFESYTENEFIVIKINTEYILFENIDYAEVRLFNQNVDPNAQGYEEIYR